jgi:hypothetical protein
MTYCDKNPSRTSVLSGYAWVLETLKTHGESHRMFRMNERFFIQLHDLLVTQYGLKSSIHMSSLESLAIFLCVCGQNRSNTSVQNTFKHTGETISRKFDDILRRLTKMAKDYIRPEDLNFGTVHKRIRGDRRMWSHFKGCIGAINGTHIGVIPAPRDYVRYIDRSGISTQNVMALVDFDMRFTYASIGQSGSMHDTSVLFHAIEHDTATFPHPPHGIYFIVLFLSCNVLFVLIFFYTCLEKYYMVNAGYPNRLRYLASYKGQRYHVPDWRRGTAPSGEQETFNYLHSSIHNVVERAFRVWKMKWIILLKMPSHPMSKQKIIVAATMYLHNFIRENHSLYRHFRRCDRDPDCIPIIPQRYARHAPSQNASDDSNLTTNDISMDRIRDNLAAIILEFRS